MPRAIYLLSPVKREDTIALPMIEFKLVVDKIDFSSCDTLMFTSKQAVKSADTLSAVWKNFPCLAIGAATAKEIKALGGKVAYQPSSFYAEILSQDIIQKFKERRLLYLRPKEVSFDSKSFLAKADIVLQEQIIYETTCKAYSIEEKPVKDAIIIFTSPSTIHCFFKHFVWDASYTAIVIGESTKVHLPEYVQYEVSDTTLISSCIEKAKKLT